MCRACRRIPHLVEQTFQCRFGHYVCGIIRHTLCMLSVTGGEEMFPVVWEYTGRRYSQPVGVLEGVPHRGLVTLPSDSGHGGAGQGGLKENRPQNNRSIGSNNERFQILVPALEISYKVRGGPL